jgi:hypothetical protein
MAFFERATYMSINPSEHISWSKKMIQGMGC